MEISFKKPDSSFPAFGPSNWPTRSKAFLSMSSSNEVHPVYISKVDASHFVCIQIFIRQCRRYLVGAKFTYLYTGSIRKNENSIGRSQWSATNIFTTFFNTFRIKRFDLKRLQLKWLLLKSLLPKSLLLKSLHLKRLRLKCSRLKITWSLWTDQFFL